MALSSPSTKYLWKMKRQLLIQNDILFYKLEGVLEGKYLLVVPKIMKDEVLKFRHDTRTSGHVGRNNTYQFVKRSFFWYGMYEDVALYVATCATCSKNKKRHRVRKAPQVEYHVGAPLERVSVDILGPFTKSNRGNTCVIMLVDMFTKWVEAYPIPHQQSEIVAEK